MNRITRAISSFQTMLIAPLKRNVLFLFDIVTLLTAEIRSTGQPCTHETGTKGSTFRLLVKVRQGSPSSPNYPALPASSRYLTGCCKVPFCGIRRSYLNKKEWMCQRSRLVFSMLDCIIYEDEPMISFKVTLMDVDGRIPAPPVIYEILWTEIFSI